MPSISARTGSILPSIVVFRLPECFPSHGFAGDGCNLINQIVGGFQTCAALKKGNGAEAPADLLLVVTERDERNRDSSGHVDVRTCVDGRSRS